MNKSTLFHSKGFRRAALASVVALGVCGASTTFAVEGTAEATGTVVTPMTISADGGTIAFGNFSVNATGGTVMLTTEGAATGDANVTLAGGSTTAALFAVTGDASKTYSISAPDIVLTGPGASSMSLEVIHDTTLGGSADADTGTLDTSGNSNIYVGGNLTVGGGQTIGSYAGTVTVTVEYN